MKTTIFFLIATCAILSFTSPSFGFQATFTPGISFSEEYTDNHYRTNNNKEHEYITTISPSFKAQILEKTGGAEIFYKPSYVVYDKFDENNILRHSANLSGWAEIAKNFRLNVSDSFVYTEEPDTEEDATIRKSREPYYTNSAGLNLTCQFGESDSFKLGYLHSILENEDSDIEDNERHNPSIAITYWFIPRQLALETNVSYTRGELEISDDFDNWTGNVKLIKKFAKHFRGFIQYTHTYMDYQGDSKKYQIYDPSIGIDYTIDQDTHLSFSVGYFYQDREESEAESGPSISGNLGKSWTFKRGSINFTGSSGYDETYFGAENLGFDIFYQAQYNASYSFTKHIRGNISSSYRRDKYMNLKTERKDNTAKAAIGLTFQPLQWMSIGLNYTYQLVNSTLDENDYVENKGLISIILSPSRPFRKK
ncbi:MAG: outer membrane beta-barrel protein [Methanosarcinaceae archaeon]